MIDAFLQDLLQRTEEATVVNRLVGVALVVGASLLGYIIVRFLIFRYLWRLIEDKAPEWNRAFENRKVYRLSSYLVPLLLACILAPILVPSSSGSRTLFSVTIWTVTVILITWIFNNSMNALLDIYNTHEMSKSMPLTGLAQAIKIIVYIMSAFIVIAIMLDMPVIYFIAVFFALLTAASFVLKDPILGFMAGIQLAGNKMVAIGDRIQMPQYGVDGFLQEISLITVKIRNIDSTISTVPTYTMVSESFKNWNEVIESAGRRIKDPLYVDIRSLKVVDADMLERLHAVSELDDILAQVQTTSGETSLHLPAEASYERTNGNLTNLSLFRAYAIKYLTQHPGINAEQPISVHVLEGTDQGIPVEVWAFAVETIVPGFHRIRSEIFEHLFSMMPVFALEPFQSPTGDDLVERLGVERNVKRDE